MIHGAKGTRVVKYRGNASSNIAPYGTLLAIVPQTAKVDARSQRLNCLLAVATLLVSTGRKVRLSKSSLLSVLRSSSRASSFRIVLSG